MFGFGFYFFLNTVLEDAVAMRLREGGKIEGEDDTGKKGREG